MRQIYQQLYEMLAAGREALLITEIAGSRATKRVLPAGGDDVGLQAARLSREASGGGVNLAAAMPDGTTVVVERLKPRSRLVIFGGGHVSLALATMAALLDMDLVVCDDRPLFANPARFPMAGEVICEAFGALAGRLSLRADDAVVVATRGHRHDEDCLAFALDGPEPFYLGMIGSKRRVAVVRKLLKQAGRDPGRLERLHSPIGLDIGAVSPAEIAVSILAEIIRESRRAETAEGRGRMEAFADLALVKWLASAPREPACVATVVRSQGSTPRRAGAKMAACLDGRTVGTIGGGCSEAAVIAEARRMAAEGAEGPRFLAVDLTDAAEEDGMVCGGQMEVLIEPLA
jgi:xanthine dehydrogenase accessory factor